jgi:hypothetical protein
MGIINFYILTIFGLSLFCPARLLDPINMDEFYNENDGTYSIPLNQRKVITEFDILDHRSHIKHKEKVLSKYMKKPYVEKNVDYNVESILDKKLKDRKR